MAQMSEPLATGPFRGSRVAEQNDRFRRSFGADPTLPGRIVITQGVEMGRPSRIEVALTEDAAIVSGAAARIDVPDDR